MERFGDLVKQFKLPKMETFGNFIFLNNSYDVYDCNIRKTMTWMERFGDFTLLNMKRFGDSVK